MRFQMHLFISGFISIRHTTKKYPNRGAKRHSKPPAQATRAASQGIAAGGGPKTDEHRLSGKDGRSSSSRVWHRSKKKTSIPHLLLVPRPQVTFDQELAGLVALADLLKAEHPGCGVDKLHYTLKPERMGSDTFCELFLGLGYGVQRVKN